MKRWSRSSNEVLISPSQNEALISTPQNEALISTRQIKRWSGLLVRALWTHSRSRSHAVHKGKRFETLQIKTKISIPTDTQDLLLRHLQVHSCAISQWFPNSSKCHWIVLYSWRIFVLTKQSSLINCDISGHVIRSSIIRHQFCATLCAWCLGHAK